MSIVAIFLLNIKGWLILQSAVLLGIGKNILYLIYRYFNAGEEL